MFDLIRYNDGLLDTLFDPIAPIKHNLNLNTNLATNIKEDEEFYYVNTVVPGLVKDNISIELKEDRILTIKASPVGSIEKEKFLMQEFSAVNGSKTIKFPKKVDSTSTVANIRNGVLELKLKKKEVELKTIEIVVN